MPKRKHNDSIAVKSPNDKQQKENANSVLGGEVLTMDHLSRKILSFLSFKDRVLCVRPISRAMKAAVNSMKPEKEILNIQFKYSGGEDDRVGFDWCSKTYSLNVHQVLEVGKGEICMPSLRSLGLNLYKPIRQMKLSVVWRMNWRMFRRINESVNMQMQVKTPFLSELELTNMDKRSAILISRTSLPQVRKVTLTNPRGALAEFLPALVSCLSGVTDLHIEVTKFALPVPKTEITDMTVEQKESIGRPLSCLSSLRGLQKLTLDASKYDNEYDGILCDRAVMRGFMAGLSEVSQLRCLDFELLALWGDNDDTVESFSRLLYNLPYLEELTCIQWCVGDAYASSAAWGSVQALVKEHPLKEFGFHVFEPTAAEFEQLSMACNTLFPQLACLRLHSDNHHDLGVDQVSKALSKLKDHPSLEFIELDIGYPWNEEDMKSLVRKCKHNYGEKVKVRVI